jgi:hypothetical protein
MSRQGPARADKRDAPPSETFILASVRQAGRIRRGTMKPSRTRAFEPADVRAMRAKLKVPRELKEKGLRIGLPSRSLPRKA